MLQFYLPEIQKIIEEKRLILVKKFEKFLLKKEPVFVQNLKGKLAKKSTAIFGSLIIIAISILARSTRDIGHDSVVNLEIAQKMVAGGKYYHDFIDFNLPLFFYLAAGANFLAKFFSISPFIAVEIISNLIGILMLYFSARILKRSEISGDQAIFNLLILSFAAGFFFRVFTLQFNEFNTKSTYLLALVFPYISYHLIAESKLKNFDQILIGFLAALIFCLKPHYAILIVIFELKKIFEKKNFISVFCLRNCLTIILCLAYLFLLFKAFSDYFINMLPQLKSYYSGSTFGNILVVLNQDIFPIFLISFLCFSIIRKKYFLLQFFFASGAFALIIISEFTANHDQRSLFYSVSFPLVIFLIFFTIKERRFDFKKDGLLLAGIFLVFQFDQRNITKLALDLCYFWPLLVLFLSKRWHKKTAISGLESKFFLPHNSNSWLAFSCLAAAASYLPYNPHLKQFSGIISALIVALIINFYQKLHEDFSKNQKFSTLSASAILVAISYFIGLHISAILNLPADYQAFKFKSPNHVSSEVIKITKTYAAAKNDEVTIINALNSSLRQGISYAGKTTNLPINFIPLFNKIGQKNAELSGFERHLTENLKQQLQDEKNKLVFVEVRSFAIAECNISFLEYYLRDAEFRKIFLRNYVFLTRIIDKRKSEKNVNFLNKEETPESLQESELIDRDVEVYIRK